MGGESAAPTPFARALCAGGAAGFAVDVSLFPIDTVKTRLQAPQGFLKAGGFTGIYRGLGAAAAGSVPGAALFFSVYETTRHVLGADSVFAQIAAASAGELCACSIRVPVEVVKQSQQAGQIDASLGRGAAQIYAAGGLAAFYRGFAATVMREVPFSILQMPLLERMKVLWVGARRGEPLAPVHVALCGSLSGGFAAAATTPLDVVKTRLMLGADAAGVAYDRGTLECARRIAAHEGPRAFFSGLSARVFWLSLGGLVYFGAYDASSSALRDAGV